MPSRHQIPEHEGAIAGATYTRHRRVHRSRGHRRPRVLQLLATGGTGGAQESYTGLLLHLDRSRYDVRAVSLSAGAAVQRVRALGVAVEVIDAPDDADAVRALTTWLRREAIDLLHAHMYRAEVVGTQAAVAAGVAAIVATVHSSRVRSAADRQLLAALTPSIDRLIVPSDAIRRKVVAEGRDGRFAVIPNGVDLSRLASVGGAAEAPVVGVVARLEPEKGHRHLLAAWPSVVARFPTARLLVVGDGSLARSLRAQATRLGIRSSVEFTGRRSDVAALTADLTVAVLPSIREAQGISILEAMAQGVPVVATSVGGIPEVLTSGVNGLLVPPADPDALADALVRLLGDAALRRRLALAARRTVEELFSLDAQVRRIQAVYDEELARAGVLISPRGSKGPSERGALELPPLG